MIVCPVALMPNTRYRNWLRLRHALVRLWTCSKLNGRSYMVSPFAVEASPRVLIMICRLRLLLLSIVAGVTSSAFGVWIGKGEVVGQVTSSGLSNDRVHFVLTIESQTNELGGPQLGDANTFTYSGTRKE